MAAAENRPLVAGYLAETMASLGIRLNQSYEKGNTVIHHLAKYGDEYATVLEYLIRIKQPNGCPAFDLDARNHEGMTLFEFLPDTSNLPVGCKGRSALHEAVLQHRHNVVDISYKAVINLLVKYGANAGLSVSSTCHFVEEIALILFLDRTEPAARHRSTSPWRSGIPSC